MNRKYVISDEFYCTKCGQHNPLTVPRMKGKQRAAGHLKRLYCFYCKIECNHAECMEFSKYSKDDFLLEYNYGNFDTEGNRKLPYGLFKDKLHKEGKI